MEDIEVEIRDISDEKARDEILALFEKEGRMFDTDVAVRLRLDLVQVIDIIDELEDE